MPNLPRSSPSFSVSRLLLLTLLPLGLSAETSLTPQAAEQIVRDEEAARRQAEADRLEQLDSRPAIDRSYLDLGERRLLYNRTAPLAPTVPASPPSIPAPAEITSTASSDIAAEDAQPSRPHHTLFLSASVYDGPVTELRWTHEGREYRAFSPLDFRDFAGLGEIQTADATHSLLMAIGPADAESLPPSDQPPVPAAFVASGLDYHLVSVTPATPSLSPAALAEALATIDALHAHHRAHAEELRIARQRREALAAARERYLRENPPVPIDTVVNFSPSPESGSLRAP